MYRLFEPAEGGYKCSASQQGRVRRGREARVILIFKTKHKALTIQKTSPQVKPFEREKKKRPNFFKLNKSLEQGLNLSRS
jgi:hypothetical protein